MSREMPATFLELVQRSVWESHDVSGGPQSVEDNSQTYRRHINWINWAWLDLQKQYPDWKFMFREAEMSWPADASRQTLDELGLGLTENANTLATLGQWKTPHVFRAWPTATPGNQPLLDFVTYHRDGGALGFKEQFLYGTTRTDTGRPQFITIHPDDSLLLHPIPNEAYTVVGEYYRAPVVMVGNGAIPEGLPMAHRLMLVYKALTEYGGYNAANEVYQKAHHEYKRMLRQLDQVQRPRNIRSGAGNSRNWRGV